MEPFHGKETCVILPHLDKQKMSVTGEDGKSKNILRWKLIKEELLFLKTVIHEKEREKGHPLRVPHAIEDCVKTYNPGMEYKFGILDDAYFKEDKNEMENVDQIILFIIDVTIAIEDLFEDPIDLLNGDGLNEQLELTRDQICAILGNAFFSTFPHREADKTKYFDYPRINFSELFDDQSNQEGWKRRFREAKVEKVKCLLNYFSRMKDRFGKDDDSRVIYERRSLSKDNIPDWGNIEEKFRDLEVHADGTIEDSLGSLQVDFANKFIGGGSLGSGAAQEEIRFICCPELIAAQLFTKVLTSHDTLLVHHFEQFSSYSGYSAKFKFSGDFRDVNVASNHIVGLDAHQYPKNSIDMQLEKKWIERELNKCFIAFQSSDFCKDENCSKIASGKWGCGVYNGDPILKSLIQWIVSSYCKKSLDLYTFGDTALCSELCDLRDMIISNKLTLGRLYSILLSYRASLYNEKSILVDFIKHSLSPQPSLVKSKSFEILAIGEDNPSSSIPEKKSPVLISSQSPSMFSISYWLSNLKRLSFQNPEVLSTLELTTAPALE